MLGATTLLRIDEPVLHLAERIGSPERRTLDAIHLASALSRGDDTEAFVTCDAPLARAAAALKRRVLQPGM